MSNKKINILHLASTGRWTGVADPVVSLCKEQLKEGHKVYLGCIRKKSFERHARNSGVKIADKINLTTMNTIFDIFHIRRFVIEKKINIVHTHLLHDHWLAMIALIGLRDRVKLIRTMHRSEKPYSDIFHKLLFNKFTDRLIFISKQDRDVFLNKINIGVKKTAVIYGGVDIEKFKPENDRVVFRNELNIPHDAPLIGIVAKIGATRGHDIFVKSAVDALKENPKIYFVIIGKGERKKPIREMILSLPEEIKTHIIMAGYRDKDLPEATVALDIAVLLAPGSEGTCRAVLEAMASGVPVIAVDLSSIPETIKDGKTGIIIEPNNSDQLTQAFLTLAGDRDLLKQMSQSARQSILERFTEQKRAEDTMKVYGRK